MFLSRFLEEYIGCVKQAASQHCGREASQWTYDMKTRLLSPTLLDLNCTSSDTNYGFLASVAMAIIICVIFLLLIVVCFYKCMKYNSYSKKTAATENIGRKPCRLKLRVLGQKNESEHQTPLLSCDIVNDPYRHSEKRRNILEVDMFSTYEPKLNHYDSIIDNVSDDYEILLE